MCRMYMTCESDLGDRSSALTEAFDVLIVSGGVGGCAAELAASDNGARVALAGSQGWPMEWDQPGIIRPEAAIFMWNCAGP